MSFETTIKALLAADGTLGATLTGGVYAYSADTRRLGITRDMSPSPFDPSTGFLRPCALVKARDQIPAGGLRDSDQQYASLRQVVEVWLYNDGDAGYTTLETARAQIYKDLEDVGLVGGGIVSWINDLNNIRDPELDLAAALRIDFVVNGSRQSS
jgi:hypothetical protein